MRRRNREQRSQPFKRMEIVVSFPYTFVLMNWAAIVGLYHFLRGQHDAWSGYESGVSLPKEKQLHEPSDRRDSKFSDAA
jgi:hypothetical protein